ncbi:MAG: ComF family protein [Alphaproteobacteria bacterium]|nr:ComF family protein [Alphaproteobacteria bacterium]
MNKAHILGKKALNWGLDLVLPPRCPITGDTVRTVGAISPRAWKEITFIAPPYCTCCGIPFAIDLDMKGLNPDDFLCTDCISSTRAFDQAKSLFVYDDGSRKMILSFKHGDAIHLHTTLAPLLCKTGVEFLSPDSIIVPVPLHWMRLVKRRYNQAAILGNEVAKLSGLTCWPDALIRTRPTPPQGHKTAKDRKQNVSGAFDINPPYTKKLSGREIVLIDDVFTTGATLEECSKVLKTAGARSVNILTLARAVKE